MNKRLLILALAAAIAWPAAMPSAAVARAPQAREATTLMTAAPAPRATRAAVNYAGREARAKDLEAFAGGRRHEVGVGVVVAVAVIALLLLI